MTTTSCPLVVSTVAFNLYGKRGGNNFTQALFWGGKRRIYNLFSNCSATIPQLPRAPDPSSQFKTAFDLSRRFSRVFYFIHLGMSLLLLWFLRVDFWGWSQKHILVGHPNWSAWASSWKYARWLVSPFLLTHFFFPLSTYNYIQICHPLDSYILPFWGQHPASVSFPSSLALSVPVCSCYCMMKLPLSPLAGLVDRMVELPKNTTHRVAQQTVGRRESG